MGKVLSAIGSTKRRTVEFMLTDEKKGAEFFIFDMSPEDALRLSCKLREASNKALHGIEDHDIPGPREKIKVCNGQKSNKKF